MTNKKILSIILILAVLNCLLLARCYHARLIRDLSIKLVDYPSYLHEWENSPYRSNLIIFRPSNERARICYELTSDLHDMFGELRKQYVEQPQLDAWVSQKIDLDEYYRKEVNLSEWKKTNFKNTVENFILSFEELTKQ